MHSTGDNQPKKGSGYFAGRLNEKGTTEEIKPATAETEKVETVSSDQTQAAPKAGQIFEESTKSIASMTDDVSETAKLVSSMKEGLVRVNKIKNLLTSNPLCDDSGNCSYQGADVTASEKEELAQNEEKIVEMINKYSQSNLSDLQSDASSIREELQQFKNSIKQKESEISQFREKLNEVRQQPIPSFNPIHDSILTQLDNTATTQNMSEFEAVTTDQDLVSFNSIQGQDFARLSEIQQSE